MLKENFATVSTKHRLLSHCPALRVSGGTVAGMRPQMHSSNFCIHTLCLLCIHKYTFKIECYSLHQIQSMHVLSGGIACIWPQMHSSSFCILLRLHCDAL